MISYFSPDLSSSIPPDFGRPDARPETTYTVARAEQKA